MNLYCQPVDVPHFVKYIETLLFDWLRASFMHLRIYLDARLNFPGTVICEDFETVSLKKIVFESICWKYENILGGVNWRNQHLLLSYISSVGGA